MTRLRLLLAFFALIYGPLLSAEALPTDTAKLTRIPQEYHFDGVVEATQRSTISAQTQGQVTEILADVDDYVEQGHLVIRLRDTEQRARLDQAQAEVTASKAQLQEAQNEFDRVRKVFERKLVAQAAMDKATAALKSAKAQRDAANAALAQAEEQLAYTEIRAPYSGIVTERLIELGETASPGQKLISGISLELLRVSVEIPQSLIPAIRQEPKARVTIPDNRIETAESVTIFPYADPASGTFKVRLKLPSGVTGLFPGMLIKTHFEIGQTEALLIPQESVVYRSEVTAVYVVGPDDKITLRHIQTGQKRNGSKVVILSGLEAGERIALDPVSAGRQLMQQSNGNRHE